MSVSSKRLLFQIAFSQLEAGPILSVTNFPLFVSSTNHFIEGILIELHKSSDLQIKNPSLTDHHVQNFLSEVRAGGGFLGLPITCHF